MPCHAARRRVSPVTLDADTRATLAGWLRRSKTPLGLARRAQALLLLDQGQPYAATARRVGLSERHVGLAAAPKRNPTVRALQWENTRSSKLSQEEASSGKIVMKDHLFSMCCKFCPLPPRRSFRESCRAPLSRNGGEHHRRSLLHW
jgi:hypothetical protein